MKDSSGIRKLLEEKFNLDYFPEDSEVGRAFKVLHDTAVTLCKTFDHQLSVAKEEKRRAEELCKRINAVRSCAIEQGIADILDVLNQTSPVEHFDDEVGHVAVGTLIRKTSLSPFKSGFKIATVRGYCYNPTTGRPSYLFEEDDSCVEVRMCKELTDEEKRTMILEGELPSKKESQ